MEGYFKHGGNQLKSRVLRGNDLDVFSLVERLEPGLMLDVGAAAGAVAQRMLKVSPESRVVAFEPFPGNHRFIDERLGSDPRVRIVKKAVSLKKGMERFHVASTVTNGKGVWAQMTGYSSVGVLVPDSDPRAGDAIEVEVCRLDDEVAEPVRFLKMDVQGHEAAVMVGAKRLFDQYGVELVFSEFAGNPRIVSFLAKRGYAIFDTEYFIRLPSAPIKESDWRTLGMINLSTGRQCAKVVPLKAPEDPKEYCEWFKTEKQSHNMWTDLIAIAPRSKLKRAVLKSEPSGWLKGLGRIMGRLVRP